MARNVRLNVLIGLVMFALVLLAATLIVAAIDLGKGSSSSTSTASLSTASFVGVASVDTSSTSSSSSSGSLLVSSCPGQYSTPISSNGIVPCAYGKVKSTLRCSDFGLLGLRVTNLTSPARYSFANATLPDPNNYVDVSFSNSATLMSFQSTLALDAVIAKAGANANVYAYTPRSNADSFLGGNSALQTLSYVEFCFSYSLQVTNTASRSLTRTTTWSVTQSPALTTLSAFAGQFTGIAYNVSVTKAAQDGNYALNGQITIYNPSPIQLTYSLQDYVTLSDSVTTAPIVLNCPTTVGALQTVTCQYSAPDSAPDSVAALDSVGDTVVVTVAANAYNVQSSSATAFYSTQVTAAGPASVTLTSPVLGTIANIGSSQTFSYTVYYQCPSIDDTTAYVNAGISSTSNTLVSTLVEVSQSVSSTYTINCYLWQGSITLFSTAYQRNYTWSGSGSATQLNATAGSFVLGISETVTISPLLAQIQGQITNPNPDSSMLVYYAWQLSTTTGVNRQTPLTQVTIAPSTTITPSIADFVAASNGAPELQYPYGDIVSVRMILEGSFGASAIASTTAPAVEQVNGPSSQDVTWGWELWEYPVNDLAHQSIWEGTFQADTTLAIYSPVITQTCGFVNNPPVVIDTVRLNAAFLTSNQVIVDSSITSANVIEFTITC